MLLTLHLLCGFGATELANAFHMNNEAAKKALLRSKEALKHVYETMNRHRDNFFKESDSDVLLTVLYLMFNEGYKRTRGHEAISKSLCFESIRLAKLLLPHLSQSGKCQALLALMFFNIARFDARTMDDGVILAIDEHDRSLYNHVFIEEGYYFLNNALALGTSHRYYIEALIASHHCAAKTFCDIDWQSIARLYELLEHDATSYKPMVTLNKYIAQSFTFPSKQLAVQIDALCESYKLDSYMKNAAIAKVYENADLSSTAMDYYKLAMEHSNNTFEKKFVARKIKSLTQKITI